MSNITFSIEHWAEFKDDLEPFIIPHWDELGLDHQDVPVSLHYDKYQALDDGGFLHIVACRDNGELIGYHIAILDVFLHYSTTKHASVDLYYLKHEYRKSKIGLEMFQFAERCFKRLGVVKIVNGSKLHLHHEKLFLGMGFKATDVVYTKII